MTEDKFEAIQNKITALLRKAERTDNEAEAAAFSAKAEELLQKWGIDKAKLDMEEGRKEEILTRTFKFDGVKGRTRRDYIELFHYVAVGLGGLKTLRVPDWRTKQDDLMVVGHESDLDSFAWLASSILIQAQTACLFWWKAKGLKSTEVTAGERSRMKSSFFLGFAVRVKTRLEATRNRLTEAAGTGTDLVLFDRDAAVNAFFDNMFPNTRKGRGRKVHGGAYDSGGYHGDNADLGQTRFRGNAGALNR